MNPTTPTQLAPFWMCFKHVASSPGWIIPNLLVLVLGVAGIFVIEWAMKKYDKELTGLLLFWCVGCAMGLIWGVFHTPLDLHENTTLANALLGNYVGYN